MSRRLAWLGAIGLLILGCGVQTPSPTSSAPTSSAPTSSAPTSSPPTGPVACSLVPGMDTLVGRASLGEPAGYVLNGIDHCTWVYANDPTRYVGVSVGPAAAHAGAIDSLGEGEQLAGFGDDGRWWAGNRLLSTTIADRALQVRLELDDAEARRELAEAIARAALEALR